MREVAGDVYADLIGKPFAWRGRGPASFDCYGLVREMLIRTGTPMPEQDTPPEREAVGAAVATAVALEFALGRWHPVDAQPGAMVLFNMPVVIAGKRRLATTHCGFMVSASEFIHAWEQTGGVTVERMHDWERRVAGFYKYHPA